MTINGELTESVISEIYWQLVVDLGQPETLHRSSPLFECDNALEVLLATILTQATSDRNALQAWRNLKCLCKEPAQIPNLKQETLLEAIKPAGLMNQRAKALTDALQAIYNRFGEYSLKPLARDPGLAWEVLNSLPGVGPKTAACTMLFGLGLPIFPVDTHINRIAGRMGWVPSNSTPTDTQTILSKIIPAEYQASLHILLLNLGRRYCRPNSPDCPRCPISLKCSFNSISKKTEKK